MLTPNLAQNNVSNQPIYISGYTYSGSNWLVGCLVDLNLYVSNYPYRGFEPPRDYRYPYGQNIIIKDRTVDASGRPVELQQTLFKNIFFSCLWHVPPTITQARSAKVIVPIRDPRDAARSQFLSERLPISFVKYLKKYNLGDAWQRYNETCLSLPNVYFIRFEDVKRDPLMQLRNLLKFCDMTFPEPLLEWVIKINSYDYLSKAEQAYRATLSEEQRNQTMVCYRSGKASEWKSVPDEAEAYESIKKYAYNVMKIFNYY